MTKTKLIESSLFFGIGVAIFILTLVSTTMVGCEDFMKELDSGGGGGGGGGTTAYCNSGNTYNFSSGKCCPNSAPYYYPGTSPLQVPKPAGCYSSCPYVGACGTRFQRY